MTTQGNGKATLIAVGDVGPIWEPVEPLVELAMPVLKQGDLRFCQVERVYSEELVNEKRVPVSPGVLHPRLANIYTAGGFNIASLASNHSLDGREVGVLHNIETFKKLGITPFGTGRNLQEARKPAIVEKNGVKVGFLGYCSIVRPWDPATDRKPGQVPLRVHTWYETIDHQPATPPRIMSRAYDEDVEALLDDVRKLRKQVDIVILSIHWGIHFVPKVLAQYQQPVAHAAIEAGADLILGCHSHNPKAIEVYKGKVCFYSLSNFVMQNAGGTGALVGAFGVPMDPNYPHLPYGVDAPKSCMAKITLSKKGVERVAFIPTLIDTKLRPEPLHAGDPRFDQLFKYWQWVSEDVPHKFRQEDDEIVVEAP